MKGGTRDGRDKDNRMIGGTETDFCTNSIYFTEFWMKINF